MPPGSTAITTIGVRFGRKRAPCLTMSLADEPGGYDWQGVAAEAAGPAKPRCYTPAVPCQ
jgi:hypothetical protein